MSILFPYCCYNGHFVNMYEPMLSFNNRAFRYGDALFETIRVVNNKVMYLQDHMHRIKVGMTLLKMTIPSGFNTDTIFSLIKELVKMNKIISDVRLRLTVFRNEGGYYTPTSNDISFLIEAEEVANKGYLINEKGLRIDIYPELQKIQNKLSCLKSANALLYVLAGLFKKENQMDEVIILNQDQRICETISSNLFVVKNGAMYTSAISEGCTDGVMRKQIIRIAKDNKILCHEISLQQNVLHNADEVFLTNAIKGIQWVAQFKTKFYQSKMTHFFSQKINEEAGIILSTEA
jgi:branched-subunit amino acid aminotransferase/4-amino-4-deoxychorismate lyase